MSYPTVLVGNIIFGFSKMTFETTGVIKASILGMIFIATLLANSFVGVIIIMNRKTFLKHATYRFLVNIIISDLVLAIFTMPFEFTRELKTDWIFGDVLCKLIEYMEIVVGGTVILSHSFVAIERYRSVVRPHLAKLRPRVVKYMIAVSWIIPALASVPYLYMFTVKTNDSGSHRICTPVALPIAWLDKLYEGIEFALLYAIPLVIICWCYYRIVWSMWLNKTRTTPNGEGEQIPRAQLAVWKSKRRVTKTAGVVVGAFLICWSPTFVLSVWRIAAGTESVHHGSALHEVAMFAAFLSEALNPILYCVFDTNFTDSFKQMVTRTASSSIATEDDVHVITDTESGRNQRRHTMSCDHLA